MSDNNQNENKNQSEQEFKHIAKTLANDLRVIKSELDKEKEIRAELEKKNLERENYLKNLENSVQKVKQEKKEQYGKILQTDVLPYLNKLKKEEDPKLNNAIKQMEGTLKTGLENAFMAEEENNTLRLVSAIASADRHRSSDLERLLTTENEWGQKYENLMSQKKAIEEIKEKKEKELLEKFNEKNTMIDNLKKELEFLREKADKNINNTSSHFHENSSSNITTTPIIQATASNKPSTNGIDSLFDFRPQTDWYSEFTDPGRSISKLK